LKVLVTGGAGFIGSHVVEKLVRDGYEARILDLSQPSFELPELVESLVGSVTDPKALELSMAGCEAVIHLAAVANVSDVLEDPSHAESVNVRGTLNVLEAARLAGVRRVVYGSTTWAYSDCAPATVDEETVPAAPSHLYTSTKLAGEMYCKAYGELYGLEFTVLRFGIPYGPRARDGGVIAAFVERALAGEPLPVAGTGLQFRRFVYVEDLAEGVVLGLQPVAANRVYNLAGRETVSVLDVANTVRKLVGAGEIVHTPSRPIDFAGKEVSSQRAEQELGWIPSTAFKDGLDRYVAWYRASNGTRAAATKARPKPRAARLSPSRGAAAPMAEYASSTASPRRVLILSADIGEGHDLPARVLAADLEEECPGIEVSIEDCLAAMGRPVQLLVRDGSEMLFRWMPWLFGLQYFLLMRFAPTRWLALKLTYLIGSRPVLKLVRRHDPDAVVSTYPGSTALIGELRRRGRLNVPTFSAITDLAGLYFWAHPGIDLHFVTHPESIEEVERVAGVDSVQWARPPTSRAFLAPRSQADAREALGLPEEGKVVVVSGGGWGVGDLQGAIRAALDVEDTTVVCLCGRNDDLRRRLERRFGGERRVRLLGFTDQMGDLLAAASALVHSTAGLTVLEAIIRGCPVVSYGFSAGHLRLNNRALERFRLADTASSQAELTGTLRRVLSARKPPDLRFANLPSAASFVVEGRARIRPLPAWRIRLAHGLATAAAAVVAVTLVFASDDSYALFAAAFDLHPMTRVSTKRDQVAVIVDAPAAMTSALARRLSKRRFRASFVLERSADASTRVKLKRLGDEELPTLDPGGPVRWLGTRGQLKRAATGLGLSRHFFYAVPGKGFTLGQYVLGHVDGATPVTGAARFTASGRPARLQRGEIVELVAGSSWRDWQTALDSLASELHETRLAAVPLTVLAGP
jgi:nucleoside-diphosphate-sugar epimerase/UDP-N-acetylglucosamine:LPS N-acetylglucosamine transferase